VSDRKFSNDFSVGEEDCLHPINVVKVTHSTKVTMQGSESGCSFRYRKWTDQETRCLKEAVLKMRMQWNLIKIQGHAFRSI